MRTVALKLLKHTLRFLLRLRYKIEVRGKDIIKDPSFAHKGVLVLPNHTAEIEPIILMTLLGDEFNLRPLVFDRFYNDPFARPIMKLLRAKPVAEFDKAVSDYRLKEAEELFRSVTDDLKKGEHILLYPSSQIKMSAEEKIGGRSLAHATIQGAPESEILLVRITGLYGSSFSKAFIQETPDFWQTLMKNMRVVFLNGLFFIPKRKVIIEFSKLPDKFPKYGTKLEFNKALEEWYNQYPTPTGRIKQEPLTIVKRYFWRKEKMPGPVYVPENKFQDLVVPKSVQQDIFFQLSELSGKSVKDIREEDDLVYDVGLDSLNIATLFTYLDTHYELEKGIEPSDLRTVNDLFAAALHVKKGGKAKKEVGHIPSSWPKEKKGRPTPLHAEGSTIIEVFLNNCKKMEGYYAAVDGTTGVIDYKRLKLAVILLARKIEKLEGKFVGVLLPSSIGAYIVILAIQLAGKVPVPLNWTVGSFFINFAIDLLEIKSIISSEKFLKRLDNVDIGHALQKIVLIENLRQSITLKDKLKGLLLSKKKTKTILKHYPVRHIKENDTAVILFTSGTTALPKAVPLTHKNILINQKNAIEQIDLGPDDVIIMALPAFHVFGLTLGILSMLIGVRAVFSPDPLDGSAIAREILKWRVSVVILAPTFFSHLFRSATLSQLKSIRICISGAEKAPQTLMEFVEKLGDVAWLEGYGLTETSPIISVNPIHERPRGVGKILPCVEAIVIDPETGKRLLIHQVGELCVRGDTIFSGYYKQDNTNTFIEVEGKKYYRTGDLAYVDETNHVMLEGRLKLSFKKGGEMITLPAIDAALLQKAKEKGWISQESGGGMPFACVPKEMATGAQRVVLFSEIPLSLDQVNQALLEAGFSRLYKVNEVRIIPSIPVLKTGKVWYQKLFEMLHEESLRKDSVK